ncbi:cell division protein ZapD [Stenoxybacter acetivorans]|uniref:cell division protein ZapD n=1 Tax=Stenoxybacter acetivorans TaxID=422441 RepID=UPI0005626F31|nr:cell division protein ZapD [Stenoxybacter acetivorans]
MNSFIHFEYPLHERIRSFLRIEFLFHRFDETYPANNVHTQHLALCTLFEIMEAAARSDLKLDILQELDRQTSLLPQYCRLSEEEKQDRAEKLYQAKLGLQNIQQKLGQHLRENEWLMAIKQHIHIPGSTSPVDMPSYYFWQNLPVDVRKQQLQTWLQNFLPTRNAIHLLLSILRQNAYSTECIALKGDYRCNLAVKNAKLLAIDVASSYAVCPDISSNKYLTYIRFLAASQQHTHGKLINIDIPFTLTLYSFDPVNP